MTEGRKTVDKAKIAAVSRRRTEKVSEIIAREIVYDSRGLPPGTMLPSEAKLLERYQVGRTSLREALRILEMQGLIVIRPGPGGGPMLTEVDSAHFGRMASLYLHKAGATYRDTLDARLILEPVVAGIIAEQQDPEQVKELQEYLQRSDTPTEEDSPPVLGERSWDDLRAFEFHMMLMGMSGNPVINLVGLSLQELRLERHAVPRTAEPLNAAAVHDMIARAIIDGRPAQAEQLMRKHMRELIDYTHEHHPGLLEQTVSWH
jgi:GntR family transcriptional repressor for pyruvate dehydrogenase complex